MLRKTSIILMALLMGIGTACNKEELEQLRKEKQQLSEQIARKDSTIQALNQMNSRIEKNLQLVIDRRGIDSTVLKSIRQSNLEQRLEGLQEAVSTTQDKMENLRSQLRGARYQAGRYREKVGKLQDTLQMRSDSIQKLHKDLMAKAKQVEKLVNQAQQKDSTIIRLKKENEDYLEALQKKTKLVNTAYVATGDEKELEENEVIVKKGGFLGLFGQTPVLDPRYNQASFEEFSIPHGREVTIKAQKRKVEVVTPHPKNAYLLEENGETTVLKITDPEQFWRAGKYLVVAY